MSAPITFDFRHERSCLNTRLEIGLDTVRIGFVSCSASWELVNRLKGKGWRYYSDKGYWIRHDEASGLRIRHYPWWISAEVSLPKLLTGSNSNLDYDHAAALARLKAIIDGDIHLGGNSTWSSPGWEHWKVRRADVTADFIFEDKEQVERTLKDLKTARVAHRPKRYIKEHGVKWATTKGKLACSAYAKLAESLREADEGKLRFSVVLGDLARKKDLPRYEMRTVEGLMSSGGAGWLRVMDEELHKVKPFHRAGILRVVVREAMRERGLGVTDSKK